jgi:hypothetical protein
LTTPLKLLARGDSGAFADLAGILFGAANLAVVAVMIGTGRVCDARKVVLEDHDLSPIGAPLPRKVEKQFPPLAWHRLNMPRMSAPGGYC